MLSIFAEYFNVASRTERRKMRDVPRRHPNDPGRWRANPRWRDLPEDF
ncbi:hypothetical protein [Pseudooceanicola sp. LIPI14-2-Ac024]